MNDYHTRDVVQFNIKENVDINITVADGDLKSEPTNCITETGTECVTHNVYTAAGSCGVLLIIGEV